MKPILVFNGIHSAGKSVLARLLSSRDEAFTYFSEIGAELRRAVGSNAMRSGEEFDAEVIRREIARDAQLESCRSIPLVETWHIGNLAYVTARSPGLGARYRQQFEERLERFKPFSILLDISWETFRSRATERVAPHEMDDLAAFYESVLDATYRIIADYRIPHCTVRNEGTVDGTLAAIRTALFRKHPFI